MSFVLEFLPEAAAEVECVTGDYEARVAASVASAAETTFTNPVLADASKAKEDTVERQY